MKGWTWLGWLNFLVLQWLCIRLCRIRNRDTGAHVGWFLVRWVLPLTGWWSGYVFVRRVGRARVLS